MSNTFDFVLKVVELAKFEVKLVKEVILPEPIKLIPATLELNPPDVGGMFEIHLSEYVRLPYNCTEWTNLNEGSEMFNITYKPTEETETFMYD